MSRAIQIAIDCADPHRLNRFWAELTGYEIEHHDAQIREVVAAGYTTMDDVFEADGATRLWEGRQGPHTWVTLADPEGNEFCVS